MERGCRASGWGDGAVAVRIFAIVEDRTLEEWTVF